MLNPAIPPDECTRRVLLTNSRADIGRMIQIFILGKRGRLLCSDPRNKLSEDKEAVLAAVTDCGASLGNASEALRADATVVAAALSSDGSALMHASEALRSDKPLVLRAVDAYGPALKHAADELRRDAEVARRAVQQNGEAIAFVAEELRDRELALVALRCAPQYGLHRLVSSDAMGALVWRDRELTLAAVRLDGTLLQYAPDGVRRNDREVCLAAIAQAPTAAQFVHQELVPRLTRVNACARPGLPLVSRLELIRSKMQLTQERVREAADDGDHAAERHQLNLVIGDMGDRGALAESVLAQIEALPIAELRFCELHVEFEGHAGSDAGGLTRELFDTLAHGLLRAPARPAPPEPAGGGKGDVDELLPSPPLFKLTPTDALVPVAAEAITARAGSWPECPSPAVEPAVLERYAACGRLAGLALAHGQTFGLPFAEHFLQLVLERPPQTLAELQAAQRADERAGAPHSLAATLTQPAFLETPLEEQGLDGVLAMSRQISEAPQLDDAPAAGSRATPRRPPPPPEAPLAEDGAAEVDDANKAAFAERWLEHKLVLSIRQQAAAFRRGVCVVVPPYLLGLLEPAELRATLGGFGLDDARLRELRERAFVARGAGSLAERLWAYLEAKEPTRRAEFLLYATGSARLPEPEAARGGGYPLQVDADEGDGTTLQPTASNGLLAPVRLARSATCFRTCYLPAVWETPDEFERGMDATLLYGSGYGNA